MTRWPSRAGVFKFYTSWGQTLKPEYDAGSDILNLKPFFFFQVFFLWLLAMAHFKQIIQVSSSLTMESKYRYKQPVFKSCTAAARGTKVHFTSRLSPVLLIKRCIIRAQSGVQSSVAFYLVPWTIGGVMSRPIKKPGVPAHGSLLFKLEHLSCKRTGGCGIRCLRRYPSAQNAQEDGGWRADPCFCHR